MTACRYSISSNAFQYIWCYWWKLKTKCICWQIKTSLEYFYIMKMCVMGINFPPFLPFIYWILESLWQCSSFCFLFQNIENQKYCQRLHILIVKTGGLHILIVKTVGLHFLIDLHINTLRKISDNLLVIKHSGSSLKYCFNKSATSYACRSSKFIVSENINIKYFIFLYTVVFFNNLCQINKI